jgi:hypothetical protein
MWKSAISSDALSYELDSGDADSAGDMVPIFSADEVGGLKEILLNPAV